ncbi:MAG TPA: hypothetical protein VID28_02650 [Methylomirabilota bacterium]|jgi:hypothetical protein
MHARSMVALLAFGAALIVGPVSLHAQSMELKSTPPARERVAPSVPERDLYPQRPSLPQRPHFFGPLSRDTKTGRAGVAGFSVPNAAVGARVAAQPDNPGWAGLGFAVEWGRPEGAN